MKRRPPLHRLAMTMVEIVVAMAILLVLMWIVMRTFQSTQLIWRTSQQTTAVYEQARMVLDFVTRDLQGMVVRTNDQVPIAYTVDSAKLPVESNRQWLIAMVSNSGIGVTSAEKDVTAEVAYFLYFKPEGVKTDGSARYDTQLYRAMTPHDHAKWNFLSDPDPTVWAAADSWDASRQALIADNLANLKISGMYWSRATNQLEDISSLPVDDPVYPRFIKIELTMQTSVDQYDDTRAFSKTVYFPGAP